MKQPAIYILANRMHGTIYTGVTSNLIQRIYQHKHAITQGFSSHYDCKRLVYFELHATMEDAITREKQIKSWNRVKKIQLIESMNPQWEELYDGLF